MHRFPFTCLLTMLCGVAGCLSGDGDGRAAPDKGAPAGACATVTGHADADGDGYGDGRTPMVGCPPEVVANADDCDDSDPSRTVERVSYLDGDGDGWGGAALPASCALPVGAVLQLGDCDDTDPAVHPEAPESCNGRDDDCDGRVDDGDTPVVDPSSWFADADGDGHGDPEERVEACAAPSAYVASSDDCDDTDSGRSPSSPERCLDGTDDDCDGVVDESCLQLLDSADAMVRGAVSRDMLATAMVVGDWDADGYDDVAVGASNSDVGGDGSGVVYVLTGPQALRGGAVDSLGGVQLVGASLDLAGFNFGPAVDLDGDGFDELLVGLLGGAEGLPGAVSVVAGPITASGDLAGIERARIMGDGQYDGLAAWAIDVASSADPAVLVGVAGDDAGPVGAGTARIFAAPIEGSLAAADASVVFEGAVEGGALGTAALFADLDGDGIDDVVLGEPGAAQVLVWTDVSAVADGTALATAAAPHRVIDADDTTELGAHVECADLTGDGHADLLIGSPAAGDPYLRSGRWDLVPGPLAAVVSVDLGSQARIVDASGFSTEAGNTGSGVVYGDIDADGVSDLLLGSPGHWTNEVGAGGVFWFSGPLTGAIDLESAERGVLGTVVEEAAGDGLAVGDLDRDGSLDVLVGAPTDVDDYGRLGVFLGGRAAW